MPAAAVIGGAAILGAVAGSQADESSSTSSSNSVSYLKLPDAYDPKEGLARETIYKQLTSLEEELNKISSSDVQRRFSSLVDEISKDPSPERIAAAEQFSNAIFAPSETALNQNLEDQRVKAANLAARQGRSLSDPILAAKLAQVQIREQANIDAQKRSLAAQEAINAPLRQAQAAATGLNQLSQQAIQNRSALFNMGNSFVQSERRFRIQQAKQIGQNQTQSSGTSGGGFKGAVGGGLSGLGAGFRIANAAGFNQQTQFSPYGGGGYYDQGPR